MSKRIKVTNRHEPDVINGWFNPDKATLLKEDQWHDGSNFISKATGSQFHHEALYYTASGNWVLNRWSNWQGSVETFEFIDKQEAAEWLIKNEYEDAELEELPEKVRKELLELINEAEL